MVNLSFKKQGFVAGAVTGAGAFNFLQSPARKCS